MGISVENYLITLPSYDVAYDDDAYDRFNNELAEVVGKRNYVLTLYRTPMNKIGFCCAIYTLCRRESDALQKCNAILKFLDSKEIKYGCKKTEIIWSGDKIYVLFDEAYSKG